MKRTADPYHLESRVENVESGETTLIIPAAKRVEETMGRSLLKLRSQSPTTSTLLLLPEDYIMLDPVKTFLHAYCQSGEVYRYGQLFKRPADSEYGSKPGGNGVLV